MRKDSKYYIDAIKYRLICCDTGLNNVSLKKSRMLIVFHLKHHILVQLLGSVMLGNGLLFSCFTPCIVLLWFSQLFMTSVFHPVVRE